MMEEKVEWGRGWPTREGKREAIVAPPLSSSSSWLIPGSLSRAYLLNTNWFFQYFLHDFITLFHATLLAIHYLMLKKCLLSVWFCFYHKHQTKLFYFSSNQWIGAIERLDLDSLQVRKMIIELLFIAFHSWYDCSLIY